MRRILSAALAISFLCLLTSCAGWRGLNSLPLPGTQGKGDGAYTIQAQLPDVVVIQPNTRVRVADVNIGNVTKIEVQDWHALVTMRINGDIHLPANSTAKVGQTSLLGSMHIELAPPKDEAPQGQLKNGSVIPLSRAGDVSDHRADPRVGGDSAQRRRPGSYSRDHPDFRDGADRS